MREYEVNDIIENIPYLDRSSWEQCRFNSYVLAQVNSKKKLELNDILKFPWEKKEDDEKNTIMTNEDIEKLKSLAKQWGEK